MATVLRYHHAQGLTTGLQSFADPSLTWFDPDAATPRTRRVLEFLSRIS